jgi:hypothetical protein
MKHKKHDRIIRDYEKQKQKHLEQIATKMLKQDEKTQQLKTKNINPDVLNLF